MERKRKGGGGFGGTRTGGAVWGYRCIADGGVVYERVPGGAGRRKWGRRRRVGSGRGVEESEGAIAGSAEARSGIRDLEVSGAGQRSNKRTGEGREWVGGGDQLQL